MQLSDNSREVISKDQHLKMIYKILLFIYINSYEPLIAACRWSSVSPNSTTNTSSSSSRTAGNGGGAAANSL